MRHKGTPKIVYPEGMKEWVKEHYKEMPSSELAEEINRRFGTKFERTQVVSMKKRWNLFGAPRERMYSKLFPKEIAQYVHENYRGVGYKLMAERLQQEFGRTYTPTQVMAFYKNNRLHAGIDTRFPKGIQNRKGKKVSPEGYQKLLASGTLFSKGHTPANKVPVGTERIDGSGYHKIKVGEPNKWEMAHKLVWIEHYGVLPEGKNIIFKDGNKDNLAPENLVAVTLAENGLMNRKKLRFKDPEKTEAGLNIARVLLKTKELRRKAEE